MRFTVKLPQICRNYVYASSAQAQYIFSKSFIGGLNMRLSQENKQKAMKE